MVAAVARYGRLDLAVNSAYAAMVGSFLATPPDLFAMTTDTTLNGTYRAMQAQAKAMREAGGGFEVQSVKIEVEPEPPRGTNNAV